MSTDDTDKEEMSEDSGSHNWLFLLLVAGVLLVFVGVLVVAVASSASGGSPSTGVIIFIGPIPIVFGSGPATGLLILIGVIIAAVSVVLFAILRRRMLEIHT